LQSLIFAKETPQIRTLREEDMPSLAELRRRFDSSQPGPLQSYSDEALVTDARSRLTPAQMVEQKLLFVLRKDGASTRTTRERSHRRPR
jgi:hypothetical protein